MSLLYIGSLDDSRNRSYADALSSKATFDYEIVPWANFAQDGFIPKAKPSLVRFGPPWYERELHRLFRGSTEDPTKEAAERPSLRRSTTNYFQLIDRIASIYPDARYLNGPGGLKAARDKVQIYREFARRGIPHPATYEITDAKSLVALLESGKSSKLFLKPETGSWGIGVGVAYLINGELRVETKTGSKPVTYSASRALKHIEDTLAHEDGAIVQDYVESALWNGNIFDVRMIFIFDDIYFSYSKASSPGSLTTNAPDGGTPTLEPLSTIPQSEREELRRTFRRLSVELGIHMFGADVRFTPEMKGIVLEINAYPSDGLMARFAIDPFTIEVEHLNRMLPPRTPTHS